MNKRLAKFYKKLTVVMAAMMVTAFMITGCSTKKAEQGSAISFTDDLGTKIELKAPAKKIISLYSGHTENLFALGLNSEIIGVGRSETYPKEVLSKKSFDYKGDVEEIIKEKPEVVLMRTTISKTYPDFVKALQNAGIQVISLYPETFGDFDKYINTLGLVTGKEKEAREKLADFHKQVEELQKASNKVSAKKKVFLETMENGLKTAAKDSFAWSSLKYAGAINIAEDAQGGPSSKTIAAYGQEMLISKAEEIQVYVAQKGGNNPSVTLEGIKKRPGFDKIKAVKENKVYIMDEKLISSPTFRFVEGVKQLQNYLYGDEIK